MLPADTPERQKQLESLLPLQVEYYVGKTGNLHYWMADPDYCKCMYIGTEEDYQKYEKLKLDEQFQAKEGEISSKPSKPSRWRKWTCRKRCSIHTAWASSVRWALRCTGDDREQSAQLPRIVKSMSRFRSASVNN